MKRTSILIAVIVLVAACTATQSAEPSGQSQSAGQSQPPAASQPPASQPAESALTGTWDGTWAIDPPYDATAGTFTMDVVQSGNTFSGSIEFTNTDCSNGTVEGTLDGSTVSFGVVTSSEPIQYDGTLNGTSMSGTWSSVACSDGTTPLTGTWEATRQ